MNPYVDSSGQEFSLHCLSGDDMGLLLEGVIHVFNSLPRGQNVAARKRLIHLKNILENDPTGKVQHQKACDLPQLPGHKDGGDNHRDCQPQKV
jgi:hypothetical protein